MDFNLSTYYPVFIFLAIILAAVGGALVMVHSIGPSQRTAVKDMTYESGMDPIGNARKRFDVKFYLIAILFLVFDVELLFLYPWAAAYHEGTIDLPEFRTIVFLEVLAYLATVVVAYVYAWRKGVFQWR